MSRSRKPEGRTVMHTVEQPALDDEIERIRPKLQLLFEDGGDDPEDVIDALLCGRARLIVDGSAFAVVTVKTGIRKNSFIIWAAFADGAGNLDFYLDRWRALAEEMDCSEILIESHRPGMERALGPSWRRISQTFRLELRS